jgi:hypothetical protein
MEGMETGKGGGLSLGLSTRGRERGTGQNCEKEQPDPGKFLAR